MIPLLHRVGPFLIYSYTVVLAVGILMAIALTGWLAKKQAIEKWFDAVLVCLISGLIGGRFGFVVANWAYFQERMSSIPRVWQGGYSYFGALTATIIGLWAWVKFSQRKQATQNKSFSLYTDLLAPGFALLCAFGWLACWFEGCAYGLETTISPVAADLPDEFGVFAMRYQTQVMGIIWSLIVFAIVLLTRTRWRNGQLFWLTLGLLSLGNIGISLLRGDPMPMINTLRVDLILNGTFVLISVGFMIHYQNHISKS